MAVDVLIEQLPDLPEPGPSQLEIRFRRLLMRCAARAREEHASDAPGASAPWQSDAKFHCYVETLRELLYDLESSPADALGPDVLSAYQTHVTWFVRELRPPEVPAFCRRLAGVDRLSPGGGGGGGGTALAGSGGLSAPRAAGRGAPGAGSLGEATPASASGLGGGGPGGAHEQAAAAGGGGGGERAQFAASAEARAAMRTQQRLQDELAEDMLGLTAEMKAGAVAMQNAIRYRGKLLDDTEGALVDSTDNAKSVAAKAKERYRAARGSFCWTCLMLLAVAGVFAVMMVYIKATAMVGVTGRRAPPKRALGGGGSGGGGVLGWT